MGSGFIGHHHAARAYGDHFAHLRTAAGGRVAVVRASADHRRSAADGSLPFRQWRHHAAPDSARPCSRTISAIHGTWSSLPMAWSTSTPGAAAITQRHATARRLPDGPAGYRRGRPGRSSSFASAIPASRAVPAAPASRSTTARFYAEVNDRIVRYALPAGTIAPTGAPEVIVSGLPLTGDHPMHPFAIDAQGGLYVNLGSATNACQVENRMPTPRASSRAPSSRRGPASGATTPIAPGSGSPPPSASPPGSATAKASHSTPRGESSRPSTAATSCARTGRSLYTPEQGANEPAEELLQLERGADYGWPYCYFDLSQQKLVLAPEYGGDGKKTVGLCAEKRAAVAAFPAHWAPNDLALYNGQQFPAAYRGGAFIAFHGSWNRAPFPRAATTSCSSRSRTARLPDHTWSSPTASPARSRSPARPRTARRDSRLDRTARSTFPTTAQDASGA